MISAQSSRLIRADLGGLQTDDDFDSRTQSMFDISGLANAGSLPSSMSLSPTRATALAYVPTMHTVPVVTTPHYEYIQEVRGHDTALVVAGPRNTKRNSFAHSCVTLLFNSRGES